MSDAILLVDLITNPAKRWPFGGYFYQLLSYWGIWFYRNNPISYQVYYLLIGQYLTNYTIEDIICVTFEKYVPTV